MKHFALEEFFNSVAAKTSGIYNYPPVNVVDIIGNNIINLVDNVLDPIVDHINLVAVIRHGYSRPELHDFMGERDSRLHMVGCAADIVIPDMAARDLKELAFWCADNLDFDRMVVYSREEYIHTSYISPEVNRHEVLFT